MYKLEAQEALNKEKVGMVHSSECVCNNGKDFSSTSTVMRPVPLSGRHERLGVCMVQDELWLTPPCKAVGLV